MKSIARRTEMDEQEERRSARTAKKTEFLEWGDGSRGEQKRTQESEYKEEPDEERRLKISGMVVEDRWSLTQGGRAWRSWWR